MHSYDDKTFFKAIKKEVSDYSDEITESFPYFCLKIFWDDLSKDDIEDAIRGLNTNDESIDAFFVDEKNKEINIIQCKSCVSEKKRQALKKEWLSFLDSVPSKLEDHDYIDNHKNARIQEIAVEYLQFKNKGFKINFHFFHLGRYSKHAFSHYEDKINYYDWNKIKDEYQEYLSKIDRTEPDSIEIQLNYDPIEPSVSGQHRTLVSIMTGDEVVNLRSQHRYKLFDKNLRFGLGKNKINKGIMDTVKTEPENFYFYNNGITITSKGFKYSRTNSKLKIDYPQIINGAQTVNAIYEAFKEDKNKISRKNPTQDAKNEAQKKMKRIKILFRVIQDKEKNVKKTSPFEERVIRFNNSQNSIKETDFYANNHEQIKLQEIFSKFGYFYEIKRGDRKYLDTGKEEHNLLKMKKTDFEYWDDKIDIEKLASIWMAYQKDPALDKIQKGNIFGYAGDKYYDAIFEKAENITEYQVKEMIFAWNLFNLISEQSDIYGNKIKGGQIISKISQFSENPENNSDKMKNFDNIREIITSSSLFNKTIKKGFENKETFLEDKESLIKQVKKYHFFTMGRYLTLAIFNLILTKCKYKQFLIEDTASFKDKKFINDYLLKPWLKTILDELLIKEYHVFNTMRGSSLKAFYVRNDTWKHIQRQFNDLNYEKDESYQEIFRLDPSAT